MTLITSATWTSDWVPMASGSHVYFSYQMAAGQIDGTGTEVATSSLTGFNFSSITNTGNYIRRTYTSSSNRCNPGISATSLGAVAQNNYNWVLLAAAGDLNNDNGTLCTAVTKLIEASPSTNLAPSVKGLIVMNLGN